VPLCRTPPPARKPQTLDGLLRVHGADAGPYFAGQQYSLAEVAATPLVQRALPVLSAHRGIDFWQLLHDASLDRCVCVGGGGVEAGELSSPGVGTECFCNLLARVMSGRGELMGRCLTPPPCARPPFLQAGALAEDCPGTPLRSVQQANR
jgi:hypothetical protein